MNKISSRTLTTLAAGVMTAALLTGCGDQGAPGVDDGGVGGPIESATSKANMTASPTAGADDTVFTAISTVESNGGTVVGLTRLDDGDPGYKVEVLDDDTLYEVRVDTSGEKPGQRTKTDSDTAERDRLQGIEVEVTDALETARQEVPGMNIAAAEVIEDNGMKWKIELDLDQGQGQNEVLIDAKSGKVIT
ncbi:PepSY domain-containing protein [Arthrobacter rhombi]|uniref:PepSY domain-containing protein n=1 Tax=Arthrobacter rhombi TaxID=71253 RepID=UPI003FD49178